MANDEVREQRPSSAADADRSYPRFYAQALPASNIDQDVLLDLDPEEARHATRALRLEHNSPIELVDGSGRIARGRLQFVGKKAVSVVIESVVVAPAPRPLITIASAIPKGSRAEDLIDLLVQTGADRLVPLDAERSVVHPGVGRSDRWHRRALAGLKQSRRVHGMGIDSPARPADLVSWSQPLRLFADTQPKVEAGIDASMQKAAEVAVAIGPEGGWSDAERVMLLDAGWQPWSLGATVMRVETAAATACAVIRYLTRP
ncbi:MAG: RsmE family RNA methyltransferase [Phycisphaeraceae bacterium]